MITLNFPTPGAPRTTPARPRHDPDRAAADRRDGADRLGGRDGERVAPPMFITNEAVPARMIASSTSMPTGARVEFFMAAPLAGR